MNHAKIFRHPTVTHHDDLMQLSRPLSAIGIDYFAIVRVDRKNQFYAISNNHAYHAHYLSNRFYNCDIHLANSNALGNRIAWDFVNRTGASAQMAQDAAEFGARHLFTILKKHPDYQEFYHFASSKNDPCINQLYLRHLDFLEKTIYYLTAEINASSLKQAWNLSFAIDDNNADFQLPTFNSEMNVKSIHPPVCQRLHYSNENTAYTLTLREMEILRWLSVGKTADDVAQLLTLSPSTVRKHIERIKCKTGCYSAFQLGMLYSNIIQG